MLLKKEVAVAVNSLLHPPGEGTPCMDAMLIVDQWDATSAHSPEPPHLSPMIPMATEDDVLTLLVGEEEDNLFLPDEQERDSMGR